MTRCPEECRRPWRPVQGKSGWEKQKEEEVKEEKEKRKEEKEKKRKKKGGMVEVRKMAEEWELWDEEEEAAKSEADAKKLVPEKFNKKIKVFGKK